MDTLLITYYTRSWTLTLVVLLKKRQSFHSGKSQWILGLDISVGTLLLHAECPGTILHYKFRYRKLFQEMLLHLSLVRKGRHSP